MWGSAAPTLWASWKKVAPFVLHFALFQPAVSGPPSSVWLILDDLSFPTCCDCLATEAGFYYAVAGPDSVSLWRAGGGTEGRRGERERVGDSDKFPFVYTQGGKRQTVCGGQGITRVAPRVLSRGPEGFLWLARSALPVHSFRNVPYCMTTHCSASHWHTCSTTAIGSNQKEKYQVSLNSNSHYESGHVYCMCMFKVQ